MLEGDLTPKAQGFSRIVAVAVYNWISKETQKTHLYRRRM